MKEKIINFLKKLKKELFGVDSFELTAEDAYNQAVFGTTDSIDRIFYSTIQNINAMILFKADHHSKCLIVELDEGEAYLKDRIIEHYNSHGFKTIEIKGETYGLEYDLLVILFNK